MLHKTILSSQKKLMIEFSAVVFLKYKGAKIALILADYLDTY
jgi:hypothetical protein